MTTTSLAAICAADTDTRNFTCACEHNVEDHLPDDIVPGRPCGHETCSCARFQRLTAFGWTLRAVGPIA